jgi:S-adenosylmethionine:tRNA ribosyltransferase-isomerase
MRAADFDYQLPKARIALYPSPVRDQSRLLVLHRDSGRIQHRPTFRELLNELRQGDLLVLNNSRVIPARLRGRKASSGGEIELLLLHENSAADWWALVRPGKRLRAGTRIQFEDAVGRTVAEALVVEKNTEGHCRLHFASDKSIRALVDQLGEVPLPPYLARSAELQDRERYQTIYAQTEGSIAAPTAGLHFTQDLLCQVQELGIETRYLTLHVGLGTFAPVKGEDLARHPMHEERFEISAATAQAINAARRQGRRIIAVGTTTVRVLESVAAQHGGELVGTVDRTRLFIYPPFHFQVVDALLTNFHLPRSTLLMLVSAFAAPGHTTGRELLLWAYREAIAQEYRFYSYGDAMFLV